MNHFTPEFNDRVIGVHGQKGREWLANLPSLQNQLAQKWSLTKLEQEPDLSYNYLAYAEDHQGMPVVLKVGVPNPELMSEIQALKTYNGGAAVKLIDADPDLGALLLERLLPGKDLRSSDDQDATRIAASLMKRIWTPLPINSDFPTAADWCRGFERYPAIYPSGGPIPENLVDTASSLAVYLLSGSEDQFLLHGDLHHMNILYGDRGWTAIDPKGVIGEPGFEVGALLLNPFPELIQWPHITQIQRERIEILGDVLGLDKRRLTNWSFVRAVLSAIWSVEDNQDCRYAIQIAESLKQLL